MTTTITTHHGDTTMTHCIGPIPSHITLPGYAEHQAYLRDQGLPHHDPGPAKPRRGDWSGACLDGAILYRAILYRALLDGACLDDASLDRASLVGASLDRATTRDTTMTTPTAYYLIRSSAGTPLAVEPITSFRQLRKLARQGRSFRWTLERLP